MIAYVLGSKHFGNVQQLKALASHFPDVNEVVVLDCDLKSRKKVFRYFVKFIILLKAKHFFYPWRNFLNKLVLNGAPEVIDSNACFFAKTPAFELTMCCLSSGLKSKTVFVGQPKRVAISSFDYIISTPSTPVQSANIFLDVLPSDATYQKFVLVKNANKKEEQVKVWSLLIGGNASGYVYSCEHYSLLMQSLLALAKKNNICWVLSSSPRTGREAEDVISDYVSSNPSVFLSINLWGAGDREKPLELMAKSSCVFVFEDSVSMLSEAVNTMLPVVALRPESQRKYNALVTPFVEYHEEKKRLIGKSINDLMELDISRWQAETHLPVDTCWTDQLYKALKRITPT